MAETTVDRIIAIGPDAMTLLTLMKGELTNYGYEVSEIKTEYEPTNGSQTFMEVRSNG